MSEFTMPSLGADMDEGVLQEWLVNPGDRVRKGDVVAVVETDKAAIEVECFDSGTVGRLLVRPGTRVPVGTPLAVIENETVPGVAGVAPAEPVRVGTRKGSPVVAADPGPETFRTPTRAEAGRTPRPERARPGRKAVREPERLRQPAPPGIRREPAGQPVRATAGPAHPAPHASAGDGTALGAGPLVRHLAALRGVELAGLHGTGPGGRITRADVEHAASPRAPRVRATPYARRLAHDLGIDLAAVGGTGEGGAVRAADVHAAAVRTAAGRTEPEQPAVRRSDRAGPAPAAAPGTRRTDTTPTDTMRRAIADLMSRSKREIPHYYLSTTVDLSAADDWLHRVNRSRPPADRLVPAALLLKAAAVAAREVPSLNGYWQDDGFVPGCAVHLGVAVSLRQGGLLAPVIHDADTLPADAVMAALKDLVQRARRGRLRGSEMSGATLTVTSLGDQGVESVFGVIHPPQVALVGFGAVVERPWAAGGMLGVRPVVTATLAGDHRATDGAVGARYLMAVDRLLRKPEEL